MADPYGPPSVTGVRPLQIAESIGVPEGTNLEVAQHLIADTEARYLQDILLDQPGILKMRNLILKSGAMPGQTPGISGARILGAASTTAPTGENRTMVITNATGPAVTFQQYEGFQTKGTPTTLSWAPDTFAAFKAAQMAGGGVILGLANAYQSGSTTVSAKRAIALWRGGCGTDGYSTGTITFTTGGTVGLVTGTGTTFVGNAKSGMFLFALGTDRSARYLGVVKSVDSNTQLTLEKNALWAGLAAGATNKTYALFNLRGLCSTPWAAEGFISFPGLTGGGVGNAQVQGAGTRFVDHGIDGSGTWSVYRSSDASCVGVVASVQSNTQLTIGAGPGGTPHTGALSNESYFIVKDGGIGTPTGVNYNIESPPVGFIAETWQSTHFFANRDAVSQNGAELDLIYYNTSPDVIDAINTSTTGSWFRPLSLKPKSALTGLASTESAMLIFHELETHGLMGTADPSSWQVKLLHDDGCYTPMTIQQYGNGAIWAGRRGIYVFDGVQMHNLLDDKATRFYRQSIGTQDKAAFPAWSMLCRDHYFLHIRYEQPVNTTFIGTQQTSNALTWCINLKTGALSFITNMALRASTLIPSSQSVMYGIESGTDPSPGSYTSYFVPGETLFDINVLNSAVDNITSTGETGPGPRVYIETKLYDFGNPELKKLFKQVQLEHLIRNGTLTIDVVLGLEKATTTFGNNSFVDTSGVYKNKRCKFLKRGTHLGFRLYTKSSSPVYYTELGPWAIGYKSMRPGRV